MTREHATTQEELIQYIHSSKPRVMGSASREGMIYQEIPFTGYEKLAVHRKSSAERVQILSEHLDFYGKTVLDIGCNIGYFCFEFARLGANCWGIDYDEKAIFIARSLKHIHGVENVHYLHRTLSLETILSLIREAGKFDIILLNSVIHWLIYNQLGSIRQVASLLNELISKEKQYIVYEPSSSNKAYYPEELTNKGVKRFFNLLGVNSYRRIGTFFTSNVNKKRQVWLGEREVHAAISEIDSLLSHQKPTVGQRLGPAHVIHTKRDKVCLRYRNLFIKTLATPDSDENFFLRNELTAVKKLSRYAEYMPVLIVGDEFGGRVYLVYEWIKGHLLTNAVVTRRDVIWISHELSHFLRILEWMGLAHNDLRPYNIFLLPKEKSILVFDFEHCGPCYAYPDRPEQSERLLLNPPVSAEEKRILAEQWSRLGGR